MNIRPAAVAGMFYPKNQEQLTADLRRMLLAAPSCRSLPRAIIVPHAGYRYSGEVAAAAYRCIQQHGEHINKVILLGPAHRYPVLGFALPSHDAFATPLGNIPINQNMRRLLLERNDVEVNDSAHAMEHCLEVQLPFLQMCLSEFSILPILVGQTSAASLLQLLRLLPSTEQSLYLVSSDLSHFHPYAEAVSIDSNTIKKIQRCDSDISPEQACGAHALNGFLQFCRLFQWRPDLLMARNSGDVTGSPEEVVGYASFKIN